MMSELDDLVARHDHPSLLKYRTYLETLAVPDASVARTSDGFILRDGDDVARIRYPNYQSLSAALEEAKKDLQVEFQHCGVAEYIASITGDPGDSKALSAALSKLGERLKAYDTLLHYERFLNDTRIRQADSELQAAKAKAQEQHSESLAEASAATDDATRKKLLQKANDSRKAHSVARTEMPAGESLVALTVVHDVPSIVEETVAAYKDRQRVKTRNAKIAAKFKKAKAQGKSK